MIKYVIISQLITIILCVIFLKKPELPQLRYYISISSFSTAFISIILFIFQIYNPISSHTHIFHFLKIGNVDCYIELLSDSLSIIVTCVTCIISSMCNFYSIGYIRKNIATFFLLINSFTFFCVFFISAANLFQMYICIEIMTGIVYFFTISNRKVEAVKSGFEIIATHIVGNSMFLLSAIYIINIFRSIKFTDISKFSIENDLQMCSIEIAALLMTASILIKSAQIFSISWLKKFTKNATIPALAIVQTSPYIASGIFIIIRLQTLFECSELIQDTIIFFGSISAIIFAIKAIFSNNIKEILGYSTSSQLGVMLTLSGFSFYGSAIILFVTYAFSKTLLFLCGGSVIYALSGEKNIDNMGQLQELLPRTYLSFMAAIASETCIPLLSSYYAIKVLISDIESSPLYKYYIITSIIIITSILTSVYLIRTAYKIFHSKSKLNETTLAYLNEGDRFMINIIYLSVFFAIFSGVIFYYSTYTNIVWKDIFAFFHHSNTLPPLLFSLISIAGLFFSIMICPYIKTKNNFTYNIPKFYSSQKSYIYLLLKNINHKLCYRNLFFLKDQLRNFEEKITPKIGIILFAIFVLLYLGSIKWK